MSSDRLRAEVENVASACRRMAKTQPQDRPVLRGGIDQIERSLEVILSMTDRIAPLDLHNILVQLAVGVGDPETDLKLMEMRQKILAHLGADSDLVGELIQYGCTHFDAGKDYEAAFAYLNRAIEIALQTGCIDRASKASACLIDIAMQAQQHSDVLALAIHHPFSGNSDIDLIGLSLISKAMAFLGGDPDSVREFQAIAAEALNAP